MSKKAVRSKFSPPGPAGRRRDVDSVSAPVHVSGGAQAKTLDYYLATTTTTTMTTTTTTPTQQFESPQQYYWRNNLPDRPSTSGGPSAPNFSKRRNLEKRETKDDLDLYPLPTNGKRLTTFYNFPLPGSSPTPEATPTPRYSPPPSGQLKPASSRSYALESQKMIESTVMAEPMNIGMALGSPTHQPVEGPRGNQNVQFESISRVHSPEDMEDNWVNASATPKPRATKWKILGSLFGGGKKHTGTPTTPFYQVQPEEVNQPVLEPNYINFPSPPPTAEEKPQKTRRRGRTNSERKINKNSGIKRSNTVPQNATLDFDSDETRKGEKVPPPRIMLDGGPMLNIDIPTVKMERYSVMFGSVLKPNNSNTSALLARRQATLEKLKTVNEALRQQVKSRGS